MTTATAVLASVPASYRVKRNEIGGAERQLRYLDQQSADFAVKQLAYGVLYADSTGRTTGSVSMALRRSTAWQAAQLVVAMRKDGVELIADVSRWLNANALAVLS
jgi:predicted AAA+ superfamily ATPase